MWGPPGQKMNDRPPKSQSPLAANAAIERRKAVKTPARQGTKATHWHSGRPTATTNRQAEGERRNPSAYHLYHPQGKLDATGLCPGLGPLRVVARTREIARGGFLAAALD